MKVYNTTYNKTTNKIVAYLLPEPVQKEGINSINYIKEYSKWYDSKIEISVDDELREFINNHFKKEFNPSIHGNFEKYNNNDISSIMDRIEVEKNFVSFTNNVFYTARLKQVDKVDVSEAVKFLQWVWLNKYTDNNDAQELYEIFKTNK